MSSLLEPRTSTSIPARSIAARTAARRRSSSAAETGALGTRAAPLPGTGGPGDPGRAPGQQPLPARRPLAPPLGRYGHDAVAAREHAQRRQLGHLGDGRQETDPRSGGRTADRNPSSRRGPPAPSQQVPRRARVCRPPTGGAVRAARGRLLALLCKKTAPSGVMSGAGAVQPLATGSRTYL